MPAVAWRLPTRAVAVLSIISSVIHLIPIGFIIGAVRATRKDGSEGASASVIIYAWREFDAISWIVLVVFSIIHLFGYGVSHVLFDETKPATDSEESLDTSQFWICFMTIVVIAYVVLGAVTNNVYVRWYTFAFVATSLVFILIVVTYCQKLKQHLKQEEPKISATDRTVTFELGSNNNPCTTTDFQRDSMNKRTYTYVPSNKIRC